MGVINQLITGGPTCIIFRTPNLFGIYLVEKSMFSNVLSARVEPSESLNCLIHAERLYFELQMCR